MNNKIIEIQNAIFRQVQRLDDDGTMGTQGKEEIARANALTNASASFIKSINCQLAILNAANRQGIENDNLRKMLGVIDEKEV